ncbi:MAG: hypothetical protein BGO65_10960 [Afipia sp. 64-13]|nr:MAG: hypothetical protein BGO65_10960 [Afipia sp. 64-13]
MLGIHLNAMLKCMCPNADAASRIVIAADVMGRTDWTCFSRQSRGRRVRTVERVASHHLVLMQSSKAQDAFAADFAFCLAEFLFQLDIPILRSP